jgi:hypothetical protein
MVVAVRCNPGSADPHGVGAPDDDVSGIADRVRSFEPDGCVPACEGELLSRPFINMNVAGATCAGSSDCGVASECLPLLPRVTRFEQLCPSTALHKMSRWRRQLRRCMRAARQGHVSLARRLRPPDLWMPVEECLFEGVREVDWDTEPLEWGGDAVPLVREGCRGHRDVSESGTREAAVGFSDQAVVQEIVEGVDDDADSTIERGTLLCAPHLSALALIAHAEGKFVKSIDEGWATVHDRVPRWPLRVVPWGMVDESERAGKPKFRMTIDLSWPPPGKLKGVTSVNDASDRTQWPAAKMLRVRDLAEAAGVMAASGVPVKMWSLDAVAFYRRYGRRYHQLGRQMMVTVDGRWLLDRRPQFGGAAVADKLGIRAANLNAYAMMKQVHEFDVSHPPTDEALVRWCKLREASAQHAGESIGEVGCRWCSLGRVGCYVDDTSGVSFNDVCGRHEDGSAMYRAEEHFKIAKSVLRRLGHDSEVTKEQKPASLQVVLGAEFDLVAKRLRLSAAKRERYAACAVRVMRAEHCPHSEFHRMTCRLVFASGMYPRGRQWLHSCFRALRAQFRLRGGKVKVSDRVRSDLALWVSELLNVKHDGVPLARVGWLPACGLPGTAAIYADASSEWGFGAWALNGKEVLVIAEEWDSNSRALLICEKELWASSAGLATLGPLLEADCFYEFTDSTVALSAMRSYTPSTEAMQQLARARFACAESKGWRLRAQRVSTHNNLWADMLSRGRMREVAEQAATLGLSTRQLPVVLLPGMVT